MWGRVRKSNRLHEFYLRQEMNKVMMKASGGTGDLLVGIEKVVQSYHVRFVTSSFSLPVKVLQLTRKHESINSVMVMTPSPFRSN